MLLQDDDTHLNDASDETNQPNMKELVMKYVNPSQLDFLTLLPLLNKYGLLTNSENYILMNPLIPDAEKGNALLYKMLPGKGPEAYELLIKCIQEETEHLGHQGIAKKLTNAIKSKKME